MLNKELESEQKKKIVQKEHAFKQIKEIALDTYFKKQQRFSIKKRCYH